MKKDTRKPATIIAELKRHLQARGEQANDALAERNHYHARATKAEQEAAEWKRRFDLLLSRTPESVTKTHREDCHATCNPALASHLCLGVCTCWGQEPAKVLLHASASNPTDVQP